MIPRIPVENWSDREINEVLEDYFLGKQKYKYNENDIKNILLESSKRKSEKYDEGT